MGNFKHTPQQEEIFQHISGSSNNLTIKARAGCGKTSTLEEASKLVPGSTFLCYNKAIAEELCSRGLKASTLHSLAYSLKPFSSTLELGKLKFLKSRLGLKSSEYIMKTLVARAKNYLPDNLDVFFRSYYRHLVNSGNITPVDGDREDLLFKESAILYHASIEEKKIVDFDDIILLLLEPSLKGRLSTLFVDESQDLGNVMIQAICNLGRRVVAVGDPAQAIYQFRGANSKAFSLIKNILVADELPLSNTFRCAKEVTKYAKRYVPDIESFRDFAGEVVVSRSEGLPIPPVGYDAYLAFTNADCFFHYVSLATSGERPQYVGNYLSAMIEALKSYRDWGQVTHAIEVGESRLRNAPNIKLASELEALESACMSGERLGINLPYLKSVLNAPTDPTCIVSTIHGSKGLEWKNVYFADALRNPSEQTMNLKYVACTRAKDKLKVVSILKPKEGLAPATPSQTMPPIITSNVVESEFDNPTKYRGGLGGSDDVVPTVKNE